MHNTPQQNADFRAAFDATNARYKAAVKADQLAAKQDQTSAEIDNLRDNAERLAKSARTLEQAEIIRDLLEGKKAEILNYDMGEEWAQSTLDAIQNELDNLNK